MNTKIKICGLRRKEDVLLAASLGADFLGFIFAPESPRYVAPMFAAEVAEAVRARPNAPKIVGVFRNEKPENVRAIAEGVGLDFVQLQGTESEADIRRIGVPAIKAVHVGRSAPRTDRHPSAAWLLFDTYDARRAGGTGRVFDWSLLAGQLPSKPFLLAGGLNPENVRAAIEVVGPDAIDLASGVESSPGIKDPRKLESLFERVRRA
jgi:phosphoribosylanthranilate isomerase